MAVPYHTANATPVIATGSIFETYLSAARANICRVISLARGLGDAEFAQAGEGILAAFDEAAEGANELIADSAANESAIFKLFPETFWRESAVAQAKGFAQ